MTPPQDSPPEDLQAALTAVARAIAESLDVREVWDRIAAACRTVAPFDAVGISELLPGERVKVIVAAGDDAARDFLVSKGPWMPEGQDERIFSRDDFSPRLWPRADDFLVLVDETARELDPTFLVDREMIEAGYHSFLRLPLGHGGHAFGAMILVSREPARFTKEHGRALRVVAEMVMLAISHERQSAAWRERHKRRAALEKLIPALTGTLDVRDVFERISQIAREIIPHDYFALGFMNEDRTRIRIHAKHGTDAPDGREFPMAPEERVLPEWDYFLVRDHEIVGPNRVRMHLVHDHPGFPKVMERDFDEQWMGVFRGLGIRSTLRAPVRLKGTVVGGIDFSSRQPDLYGEEEAEFAVRVAEHVTLALTHQELAREAKRSVDAQDRAAQLEERVQVLAQELEALTPHRALGRSRSWRGALAQAAKVAPTDTTVLITGESGTGKEVVARFVHRASARKDGPFVALNCAALPEQLLESELFGHEKGAFTGALAARPGKIEQAAGGVLFLDEVGEMSPAVQAKFLRVLQEREYQRLGGSRTLKADVRVLAATNRNLKAAIGQGGFREDLYYRLAVFDVPLPALRERPEDIELLAESFLEEIGRSVGRPAAGLSEEVRDKLVAYPWPGNVRELRNAIERAVILCEGGLVTSEHLPIGIAATPRTVPSKPAPPASPVPSTLDAAEREMIVQALTRAGNNKSKAARLLGLTRAQLRSRIEKHGLVVADQ